MGQDLPVQPGDTLLGKYRVESVLGKGGMGMVVAARHLDLDELFAIKLMLPSGLDSAEAVERFLREARSAAKLKGEHVAKVQDVGRLDDGTPYMIMEHLEGSDLRRHLRKNGPLPVGDAVMFVLHACETLAEAHRLGIVHRDVKSANLFLTHRPNGTPCVKVLDFGISKQQTGDVGLTTTGTVGGSPLYMSPEQMRSTKHVDHRTDIWAIGVVLHELLVGKTPFHAESITAVAGCVLQDDPEPPSQTRPDVPPWLDAVVARCLVKKPDGRFQSMEELIAALQAGLSTMSGSFARPPGVSSSDLSLHVAPAISSPYSPNTVPEALDPSSSQTRRMGPAPLSAHVPHTPAVPYSPPLAPPAPASYPGAMAPPAAAGLQPAQTGPEAYRSSLPSIPHPTSSTTASFSQVSAPMGSISASTATGTSSKWVPLALGAAMFVVVLTVMLSVLSLGGDDAQGPAAAASPESTSEPATAVTIEPAVVPAKTAESEEPTTSAASAEPDPEPAPEPTATATAEAAPPANNAWNTASTPSKTVATPVKTSAPPVRKKPRSLY